MSVERAVLAKGTKKEYSTIVVFETDLAALAASGPTTQTAGSFLIALTLLPYLF